LQATAGFGRKTKGRRAPAGFRVGAKS